MKADTQPQCTYKKIGKWWKLTPNPSVPIEKQVSSESWLATPVYL